MKYVLVLSKRIKLVIEAETEADAVHKALLQEESGEHVIQWVDCPAMVEVETKEDE